MIIDIEFDMNMVKVYCSGGHIIVHGPVQEYFLISAIMEEYKQYGPGEGEHAIKKLIEKWLINNGDKNE